jgi:radical SAM-linked protein
MYKYVISFSKNGYIKYTSHLDMMRMFKRSFRRADIKLQYSQGFNPHPKMGFAQPLSLGYSADEEYIELETRQEYDKTVLVDDLSGNMPAGIVLTGAGRVPDDARSLAASVEAAVYTVEFPVPYFSQDFKALVQDYLVQDEIIAEKKQKKTRKLIEVDIRSKIKSIDVAPNEAEKLKMELLLDCGSSSNLSPELVIGTFISFADLKCERYEIEVSRNKLILPGDYRIEWM